MDLNFNHLYYFWVIAKELNISSAAKKLRLSQPALSLQLKKLEEAFGGPLFDRGKALRLTEEGKRLLPYVDELFHSAAELQEAFRAESGGKMKLLKVGAGSSLSKNLQYYFLKPLILDSDVHIEVFNSDDSDLLKRLKNFEIDLIISNHPLKTDARTYLCKEIASFSCCVVGKSTLPENLSLVELLGKHPLFLPSLGSDLRNKLENFFLEHKINPQIMGDIEDTGLLRLFITSGMGIGIISRIGIIRDIERGELKILRSLPSIKESFYVIGKRQTFEEHNIFDLIQQFRGLFPSL